MESSVNTSSDTNIIGLLDDIFSDVPLVATYVSEDPALVYHEYTTTNLFYESQ